MNSEDLDQAEKTRRFVQMLDIVTFCAFLGGLVVGLQHYAEGKEGSPLFRSMFGIGLSFIVGSLKWSYIDSKARFHQACRAWAPQVFSGVMTVIGTEGSIFQYRNAFVFSPV